MTAIVVRCPDFAKFGWEHPTFTTVSRSAGKPILKYALILHQAEKKPRRGGAWSHLTC